MGVLKEDLLKIFAAGLEAVRPDQALLRHLHLEGNILSAAGRSFDLARGRLLVVGAGKGAAPMAQAAETLLGGFIDRGLVVVKYGHGLALERIEIAEASHPEPDQAGAEAAERIMALAAEAGPDDLLVCLFTGGASALLPAPAPGVTLADLQKTTSLLLGSGADIREINAVRKHLSRLSGGRLAEICKGHVLAVMVSDVVGDDLGAIASGPTAPDETTYQDCLAIIRKYGMDAAIPVPVHAVLEDGARGLRPETPKPGDRIFERVTNIIVASNAQALKAAGQEAVALGYTVDTLEEPLGGEAAAAAKMLVSRAEGMAAGLKMGDRPVCLLAGGETTVTLKGKGRGGRNQEMALAAAIELVDRPRIAALFAGTDGTDGPTDAAGGFATADSVDRLGGMTAAQAFLAENDSYNALAKAGDLLVTGPTRTNVMDMAILLVEPPAVS